MMLLAIDIGNSNITIGVWEQETLRQEWRLQTVRDRTADEYGLLMSGSLRHSGFSEAVEGIILASVVPYLTQTFIDLCRSILQIEPLVVSTNIDLGLNLLVDNPHEVGADRIVNAIAGYALFQQPCIIIDMGTATTFDVVSKEGALLGVAIAPGLGLAANALTSRAARLSQVPLSAPPQATGKNTVHAVQSGLIFGYVALIEGMTRRLLQEHPDQDSNIKILGTGGLISLVSRHTELFDLVDPTLTLNGLRLIYERINGPSIPSI